MSKDRLVLGWMTDVSCRAAYPDDRECPITVGDHEPTYRRVKVRARAALVLDRLSGLRFLERVEKGARPVASVSA